MIALPPPKPERTDSATFPAKADAFVAWMADQLVPAFNTDIAAMNTNDTRDTSVSSVLIGSGTKVFTVSAGKSYSAGQWLTISNTPAPTNQMIANVTSYSGTTLTVSVPVNGVFGSGTLAAWTIALTAAPSAAVSAAMAPVTAAATLDAGRTALGVSSRFYFQARDEKANGTAGGASVAGDQTRTLNTVVSNTITGASLASNQITLPAGTYRVRASAPAFNVASHQLRLSNITDSAVTIRGTNEYTFAAVQTRSVVEGRFTIAATKALALTHYTNQVVATNGLGVVINIGATENYATIEIWQE